MRFVNICIQKILELTRKDWNLHGKHNRQPSSVVLIGHSMGGIVARGVVALPSFTPGSVETIITLCSPHSNLPAYVDPALRAQLDAINTFWLNGLIVYPHVNTNLSDPDPAVLNRLAEARARLGSVVLASIAGGRRDLLVPTRLADVRGFCPPSNGCA